MGTTVAATSTTTSEEWRGPVLEGLRKLLAEGATDKAIAVIEKLIARNSELELQLSKQSKGKNREGVSRAQLLLLLEGLSAGRSDGNEAAEGAGAAQPCSTFDDANDKLRNASGIDAGADNQERKPPPQPSLRRPIPESLRRVDNPIAVPVDQRACPKCGSERECIGHDVTEVLDLIPAEVIVRLDRREKLRCKPCEGELARAPMGDKVVSGGRLGSRLVAELLTDKYDDGLPLHRQKQRYERLGLSLAVSTLADQVTWATDLLEPIWRAARRSVLASVVMHVDATSLPVLDREKKTHKRKGTGKRLGSLWGYVGDETALYLYCSTGHKVGQTEDDIGPEQFLNHRQGYVVADAATVFDASFKRADLIECGCNMHARRYFVKALDRGDQRAALPIAAFKKLYAIEDDIRGHAESAKRAERQARSKPVYDEIVSWCRTYEPHEPPRSPLGTALGYLLNNEEALTRFIDDGRVPIDNGAVERLHVRAALTRKNFLFVGSDAGGRRAAIAYTILGSCRLAVVNPAEYLADVLPQLGRGIRASEAKNLLPAAWKASRDRESAPAAAE